jgi:hypothetical protein
MVRLLLRKVGLTFARAFGMAIIDAQTGKALGRALLIPWRGKIHVIGLEAAVRPTFLPQTRLTYWKQEIGFTVHCAPDFPRSHANKELGS